MKTDKQPSLRKAIRDLIIYLIICIVPLLFILWQKDTIIIKFGIRKYDQVMLVGWAFLAIGWAVKITQFGRRIWKQKTAKAAEQERRMRRLRPDEDNNTQLIQDTRGQIDKVEETLVFQGKKVRQILNSLLNVMATMQENLRELIQTNDASYLEETVQILNRLEQRLCTDIRSMINLCIIAETPELLNRAEMQKIKDRSYKRLEVAHDAVELAALRINKYNSRGFEDGSDIEAYQTTIAQLKSLLDNDAEEEF